MTNSADVTCPKSNFHVIIAKILMRFSQARAWPLFDRYSTPREHFMTYYIFIHCLCGCGKLSVSTLKMVFQCNICIEFQCDNFAILLNHIGRVHACDPNFSILCGIDACSRTYSNYRALRNHISAQHRHLLQGNDPILDTVFAPNYASNVDSDSTSSSSSDSDDDNDMVERQMRKANAFWLLKMKQEGQISQTCIDTIVSSTTEIVRNNVNTMKTQVVRALQQTGIDYKNVPGIQEIFQDSNVCMNPFAGISTAASQSKFYKINFGLVVSILHYMPAFIIPCG